MAALANPKHERFCLEYCAGEGPTSAYQRAGFKEGHNPRIAGLRLLAQPHIKVRVKELLELFAERALLKAQQIQQALLPALEINPQDLIGEDGKIKPLRELQRDHAAAIKSMRFDRNGRVNEITLLDKVAVASTLLRSIGAISDGETNVKVSVLAGLGIGVDEEALLESELRRAIEADRAHEAAEPVQLDMLIEGAA
jgi:hypothetical protein